ncbi:2404_t:CDS:2 [Acaulospora colombiana]|uniref:2404_t:CDS:1 n=1 Tax=Acaulospora colombiana TaxID=27376 RepID=A0ACA9KP97_9GLOM|nr:2404_t:CDS:2 [Acaulospora colombiana]
MASIHTLYKESTDTKNFQGRGYKLNSTRERELESQCNELLLETEFFANKCSEFRNAKALAEARSDVKSKSLPQNEVVLTKASKRNLRRKEQRRIKKARLQGPVNQSIDEKPTPDSDDEQDTTPNDDQDDRDKRLNIFYDEKKHKTQLETRLSTEDQSREYIRSLWISEDFLATDLKSTNIYQPTNIISPKFTFLEKFLEKRSQRQIVRKLVNQSLLTPDTVKHNTYTLNFGALSISQLDILSDAIYGELYKNGVSEKSLLPQSSQSISTTFVIPVDFMHLLETEIFGNNNSADSTSTIFGDASSADLERKKIWGDFALKHGYEYEEAQNKPLEDHNIREVFQQNPKDKLYIAHETTKKVAHGIDLECYLHIFNPRCFKNAFGETVVDFFDLANPLVAKNAQIVINHYYNHTLNHPSHQSKQFAKNMIEHFCGFTDSNNVPYTTANTASSHFREHLTSKMKNLNLGPNVPKSFGAFPTVGINYNTISQFHRDLKDHRNTLCVVCPLGIFEGGELTFPELKLSIHAKEGHGIAFRSNLLIHGNLPIITGTRHSVLDMNRGDDSRSGDTNASKDESPPKYSPPKLCPENYQIKLKNSRRDNLDLEPPRNGQPAQYKKLANPK